MDYKVVHSEVTSNKVREGVIYERSKYLKQWRERWMVLTHNYIFTFVNKSLKEIVMAVDLREIRALKSYVKKEEDMLASGYQIRTFDEKYYFCCRNGFQKWSWLLSFERSLDFKYLGKSTYNSKESIKNQGIMSQLDYEKIKNQQKTTLNLKNPQELKINDLQAEIENLKKERIKNQEQNKNTLRVLYEENKKMNNEIEMLKSINKTLHEQSRDRKDQSNKTANLQQTKVQSQQQYNKQLNQNQVEQVNNLNLFVGVLSGSSNGDKIIQSEKKQIEQQITSKDKKLSLISKVYEQTIQKIFFSDSKPNESEAQVTTEVDMEDKFSQNEIEKVTAFIVENTSTSQDNLPEEEIIKPQRSGSRVSDLLKLFQFKSKSNLDSHQIPLVKLPSLSPTKSSKGEPSLFEALNANRQQTVSNLFKQFHPLCHEYGGLKAATEFLFQISSNRKWGYQGAVIIEAKAHENRHRFAEVLIEMVGVYSQELMIVNLCKFLQVILFEAPSLFNQGNIAKIKKLLLSFSTNIGVNSAGIVFKCMFILHKLKKYEFGEQQRKKMQQRLSNVLYSGQQQYRSWAKRFLEDL